MNKNILLYRHYGATSGGGSSTTIEYVEFVKLMSDIGFSSHSDFSGNVIMKIYIDNQISDKSDGGIEKEITRGELIAIVLRLAIHLYLTTPKRKSILEKESRRDKSISYFKLPSYAEALEMIIHDHVAPLMNRIFSGASICRLLAQEDILLYFFEQKDRLLDFFQKHAGSDQNADGDLTEKTIEIDEFSLLIDNAELFLKGKADDQEIELTGKDVRQIFALSQHDAALDEDERNIVEGSFDKNSHLMQ